MNQQIVNLLKENNRLMKEILNKLDNKTSISNIIQQLDNSSTMNDHELIGNDDDGFFFINKEEVKDELKNLKLSLIQGIEKNASKKSGKGILDKKTRTIPKLMLITNVDNSYIYYNQAVMGQETHKNSSAIKSIKLTNKNEIIITFVRGNSYLYNSQSIDLNKLFEYFIKSDSLGSFFLKNIKNNPKIECFKLTA